MAGKLELEIKREEREARREEREARREEQEATREAKREEREAQRVARELDNERLNSAIKLMSTGDPAGMIAGKAILAQLGLI
jgi:hypothetical protein